LSGPESLESHSKNSKSWAWDDKYLNKFENYYKKEI
jgi:hypothetical protein